MGTAVVDGLVERLGLAVAADNDVLAHGMGEAWRGACRGARSAVLVAAGTGVGGAFLVDGRPWHGARSAAGHVDNLAVPEADGVPCRCGRTGHVEAVATGPGCTGCTWPVAATRRRSTRCGPPVGRWAAASEGWRTPSTPRSSWWVAGSRARDRCGGTPSPRPSMAN
ncbi:MAG: ROK family protein [Actinomycetales bacterium]|nr:ROK family protein [Actinomycetales bacterium]